MRSFGTEDRETQFPIAPQSQIYDYILFRGSDIKDIRVINNSLPHPNDPAIMQVQLPSGHMPHFSVPNMNQQAQIPPMGTTSGGYGNPFGTMGGLNTMAGTSAGGGGNNVGNVPPNLAPGSAAPGFMMSNHQQQQPQQQQQQQQPQQVPQQQKLQQGQQTQQHQKQPSKHINCCECNSKRYKKTITYVFFFV